MTTVGKIHDVPKEFEWQISNFFSLPIDGTSCVSPSFSFVDESWYLYIIPNGRAEKGSVGYIELYLVRKKSRPRIHLSFSFNLKTVYGKKYPGKQFTHVYKKRGGWGSHKFMARSKLFERGSKLVPFDTLTIVCTMKHDSKSMENTASSAAQDVLNIFKELFLKKEDCDVVIKVQGKEFQAHRIILQARSPVLAATFRSNMKEQATGVIEIEDCDPSSFTDFLCFLYYGELKKMSRKNVFSLYYTADKYNVQDLRAKCVDFLEEKLCVDTFCETISLALRHSEKQLVESATQFFIKNAPDLILTQQWQSFLAENPKESSELVKLLVPEPNTLNLNK